MTKPSIRWMVKGVRQQATPNGRAGTFDLRKGSKLDYPILSLMHSTAMKATWICLGREDFSTLRSARKAGVGGRVRTGVAPGPTWSNQKFFSEGAAHRSLKIKSGHWRKNLPSRNRLTNAREVSCFWIVIPRRRGTIRPEKVRWLSSAANTASVARFVSDAWACSVLQSGRPINSERRQTLLRKPYQSVNR